MVKKIAITLLCTALGTSLYGETGKSFIGFESGYATVQGDIAGSFFPSQHIHGYKGSGVEYGIRIGAKNEEWRATALWNYFNNGKGNSTQFYEKKVVSIDNFVFHSNQSDFQPFVGINLGYVNYQSEDNIDVSGVLYGAQIGILANISDNIDMDLQYRYSLADAARINHNASFDHISSIVFGINYLY